MRHSYLVRLMGLFVALTLLFPAFPVAATPSFSPDFDGDGITDALETAGWYNLLGTSFTTDPLDADSDNDGLTDGEEKLFGTNPNYDRSPGLYARYNDSFLTREYFSTTDTDYFIALRGGDQYIMTSAMVLRRGATLQIGGPRDASLSITSEGLTTLSPSKDVANGGWKVTVPSSAMAGTYTATLSLSGWSRSLPIYVIYELPTPTSSSNFIYNLTQGAIERFAYDDDPDDIRDEISIWFYTPEWSYYKTCGTAPCSADPYGVKRGHAQAFYTDQFKKYVFLTYAIPAIQGTSSQSTAVTQLLAKADTEFRTNYSKIQKTFYSAMYRWDDGTGITMDGGGCESNAGVLTTMLRSAGIVARPFLVDWNKTSGHGESITGIPYQYDHSVLIWVSGSWKGARSYASVGDAYYPWTENVKSPTTIYKYYADKAGDGIITVNELWEPERKPEGGVLRGTVNVGYVTPTDAEQQQAYYETRDFEWNGIAPLEIEQSPAIDILNYETWYNDGWAPIEWGLDEYGNPKDPSQTYDLPSGVPAYAGSVENWPYNPVPDSCPPSVPTDVCQNFIETWGALSVQQSANLPATQETHEIFLPLVQATTEPAASNSVQLGGVVRDYGVDLDGNGRFDQLVVEAEVSVARAGTYQIGGWLQAGTQVLPAQTDQIHLNSRYLNAKSQIVKFVFAGEDLGLTETAGPYTVLELWVGEPGQFTFVGQEAEPGTYDRQEPRYATAAYAADAFETVGALFGDEFSHRGVDADGDGYYESLAIDVPLELTYGEGYKVVGDLYDGDGNYLGQDTWEGAGDSAELQFSIAGTSAPYTLEQLVLFNAEGRLLDSLHKKAYVVSELEGVAGRMVSLNSEPTAVSDEFSVLGARDTGVFTTTLVDNALKITMGVTVDAPGGTYRVEGLLVDERDKPVAWSVSDPQSLAAGSGEMTLTFAGPLLYDHMLHEPASQSFKLVAVKIFSGNLSSATLEDSVNVATTTPEYTRDDFSPANGAVVFFEDDTEGGTGDWSWTSSVWSLGTSIWHSWSHAWRASTSGDGTLSLASALPVNPADYVGPYLRFRTAHDMGTGDVGRLQVSLDGGAWTDVTTYTDETPHWDTEWVDLSSLGEGSTTRFRFNADGSSGLVWYVDDVSFIGWPAVKEASFTYQAPDPILTGQEVIFVASYDSISTTLPITYTWDFNDGTPLLSTATPTVTHVYQSGDDYTVGLTVKNPYDEATASDAFSVYEALTGVSFTHSSATPASDWDAVFTAVYTPTTATQPVIHTWNFGDESAPVVTSDSTVAHTYTTNGTYTVWVTAENGYGDPVTYSKDITVPLDNDEDGLVNSVEDGIGTDPDDGDSDDDGVPDDVEVGDPQDPTDSDGDGTIDALDPDDDDDGIPTIDEGTGDPDDDDLPNYLDPDSDGDGIPDETEGTGDPDDDDLPNYLDPDSDGDGISDVIEGTGNPDGDSLPNYLDTDSDGDGISDATEGTGNPDNDSTPNYLDTDSDGDGIPDATEGAGNPDGDSTPNYLDTDSDGDGIPDATEGTGNPDGDSLPNYLDTDSDGDGIPDATEGTGNPDGDSLPNYLDPDSDGDGIPDATEGTGDSDGDGTPNYLDTDSDDDGIPDATEGTGNPDGDSLPNYLDTDSDGDGIPDETEGTSDTDGDGRPDYRDKDDDGDGIPTEDEDVNNDGNPANDDTDGDSVPDYLDDDDDGDGIPTEDEDVNNDGNPANDDTDGDGTPNYRDDDDDGDGVPTANEDVDGNGDPTNDDTDGDGTPNYRDDDDDNDGIPTEDEDLNGDGDPTNDDTDGGSIPDYLDEDDDDDGIPTADEDVDGDGNPADDDTDGDGTPNYRDDDDDNDDIPTADEDVDGDGDPTNDDTDGDGVPNYRDDDDDGDGVPTIDEELTGDADGDGIPDYLDNNYNPSFTSAAVLTATEDVAYTYAVTTKELDAGDRLTITAQVKPSWLTLVDHKNGTAALSGIPTNDHVGNHRVSLRVVDGKGAMATQLFTITVVNVNDAPIAADDAVVGYRDYTSEVAVLENDHDVDAGDTLTIGSYDATTAEGGTVSCSATLCTYTPLHGYDGLDTFTYTVRDLAGATDTATVTITVTTKVPGVGYVTYLPVVQRLKL